MFQYKVRSLILLTAAIAVLAFYFANIRNEKVLPKFGVSDGTVWFANQQDCTPGNLRRLVLEMNDEVIGYDLIFNGIQIDESMVSILSKSQNIRHISFAYCGISPGLIQKLDGTPGLMNVMLADCDPVSRSIDDEFKKLKLSFTIKVARAEGYNAGQTYR